MAGNDATIPAEVFDQCSDKKRVVGGAAKPVAAGAPVSGQIDRNHFVCRRHRAHVRGEYPCITARAMDVDDALAVRLRRWGQVFVVDPQSFDLC